MCPSVQAYMRGSLTWDHRYKQFSLQFYTILMAHADGDIGVAGAYLKSHEYAPPPEQFANVTNFFVRAFMLALSVLRALFPQRISLACTRRQFSCSARALSNSGPPATATASSQP